MNKIKIEHLAPYLPYDLKLIFEKSGRIITMLSCYTEGAVHIIDIEEDNNYNLSVYDLKPILTPLQKCYSWSSEMMAIKMDYPDKKKLERFAKGKIKLEDLPYRIIQICFANHIDIFGLYPQGLAVEKN